MTRYGLLWLVGCVIAAMMVMAVLFGPFDWTQIPVQQAGLAGLVVAGGWFAGFLLREISQQIGRSERLRDYHRALYAEIMHNLDNLGSPDDLREHAETVLASMELDEGFVPFIPHEKNDTIFKAVVSDLHILPRASIDPVVKYYSQVSAMDAMINDMRGEGYSSMTRERRAALYRDYIGIKINLIEFGNDALKRIDAHDKRKRGT
ncbi:hypothetical protein [Anianabacter salinae]|uniref:hypothetical protein n=1 Tax=Anianabacter salinae TaxID=2851023 RepID=UPI00225E134E|nr:hypothetical protein [Anianabacter salinae]MBV0913926.1 hypothetical protein [Anianabacter salinae]